MQRVFLLLMLIGVMAHGQTGVHFANNSLTPITTNSVLGGPVTGPISGLGSYYFALFIAPTGTLDTSAFNFTGYYATNIAAPGLFFRGSVIIFAGTSSFIVRGWSANIGSDFASVQTYLANPTFDGWYGESQIATVTPSGEAFPSAPLFHPDSAFGRIPGFNLNMYSAVPEPSAVVLGLLGGAALFFFRRRARH